MNALLSPQSAHRLMWNRFIKNKQGVGGNIALDLHLECYNKSVKKQLKTWFGCIQEVPSPNLSFIGNQNKSDVEFWLQPFCV